LTIAANLRFDQPPLSGIEDIGQEAIRQQPMLLNFSLTAQPFHETTHELRLRMGDRSALNRTGEGASSDAKLPFADLNLFDVVLSIWNLWQADQCRSPSPRVEITELTNCIPPDSER
jgi:hypothetical protein